MCDALWVLGDGDVVLVVSAHGCLLDVVLYRVYGMCDVLWAQGDGDVILVVFALLLMTLESNCEGKIRISERFDTVYKHWEKNWKFYTAEYFDKISVQFKGGET